MTANKKRILIVGGVAGGATAAARIRRMKEESGYPNAKVVATGGLGKIIANETDMIDVYDSQLTLKGLRFIYEKNKKNK